MTNIISKRPTLIPPSKCTWREFFTYYGERLNEFVAEDGNSFVNSDLLSARPFCKTCGSLSQFPTVLYISKHIPGFLECSGFGEVKCFSMPTCDICDNAPADRMLRSCVHDEKDIPKI